MKSYRVAFGDEFKKEALHSNAYHNYSLLTTHYSLKKERLCRSF